MTKNVPILDGEGRILHGDEVAEGLAQLLHPNLGHGAASIRKMADDDEAERSGQDRHEGIAVEVEREGLHQHDDAEPDQRGRAVLPGPAAKPARPAVACVSRPARSFAHRSERDAAQEVLAQKRR